MARTAGPPLRPPKGRRASRPAQRASAAGKTDRGPRRPADAVRLAAVRAYLEFRAGQDFRANAPAALAEPEQRRLYAHLVRGLVRHQRLLETLVERLGGRPLARLDEEAIAVAMLGLYQLRFTAAPPHAAVYEAVELMGALGLASAKAWVNGVLRAAQRQQHALTAWQQGLTLAQRTSHPDWLVERWTARYGSAAAQAICEANAQFETLSVRVEPGISRVALLERLNAAGVEAGPHPLLPGAAIAANVGALLRSAPFAAGLCTVQDVSSQVLGAWVFPHLQGRVLDACAAPGGKLTQLLALAGGRAQVTALDVRPRRLRRIRENLARLRLRDDPHGALGTPPRLLAADARYLPFGTARTSLWDAILLDVPCSATGMIRKYPELKWRKTPADLPRFAAQQAEMLEAAAAALAPGGLLVYSTCSLEPEENDQQIGRFLAAHGEFRRRPFSALPAPAGLGDASGTLQTPEGDLLLLPAADRMGIYATLLEKSPAPSGTAPAERRAL